MECHSWLVSLPRIILQWKLPLMLLTGLSLLMDFLQSEVLADGVARDGGHTSNDHSVLWFWEKNSGRWAWLCLDVIPESFIPIPVHSPCPLASGVTTIILFSFFYFLFFPGPGPSSSYLSFSSSFHLLWRWNCNIFNFFSLLVHGFKCRLKVHKTKYFMGW